VKMKNEPDELKEEMKVCRNSVKKEAAVVLWNQGWTEEEIATALNKSQSWVGQNR